MEGNPLVNLLRDALGRDAVRRMERGIVAERTSAVRTRETRVHDQLLPWLPGRAIPPSFQVHGPKLKNNVILASTILNE